MASSRQLLGAIEQQLAREPRETRRYGIEVGALRLTRLHEPDGSGNRALLSTADSSHPGLDRDAGHLWSTASAALAAFAHWCETRGRLGYGGLSDETETVRLVEYRPVTRTVWARQPGEGEDRGEAYQYVPSLLQL